MAVLLLDDLVSYHKCDENSPTATRVDETGNHSLLAVNSGVNVVNPSILNLGIRGTQNVNNYLAESGSNTEIDASLNGAYTVSLWGRMAAGTTTKNGLYLNQWNDTDRGFQIRYRRFSSANRMQMVATSDGSTGVTAQDTTVIAVDTWYHLVGVVDANNNRVGISVNRNTFTWAALGGSPYKSSEPLRSLIIVGASGVDSAGLCDEMGIWNRELNTDELDTLFGSGTPPSFDTFVGSSVSTAKLFIMKNLLLDPRRRR